MSYKIEWSTNGVLVEILTGFSAEDFAKMNDELFRNAKTSKLEHIILSTLKVDPGPTTDIPIAENDFLRSITDATQALKIAFVSSHPLINESIDSYITESKEFGNHWQMKRFENFDDANTWVEL